MVIAVGQALRHTCPPKLCLCAVRQQFVAEKRPGPFFLTHASRYNPIRHNAIRPVIAATLA